MVASEWEPARSFVVVTSVTAFVSPRAILATGVAVPEERVVPRSGGDRCIWHWPCDGGMDEEDEDEDEEDDSCWKEGWGTIEEEAVEEAVAAGDRDANVGEFSLYSLFTESALLRSAEREFGLGHVCVEQQQEEEGEEYVLEFVLILSVLALLLLFCVINEACDDDDDDDCCVEAGQAGSPAQPMVGTAHPSSPTTIAPSGEFTPATPFFFDFGDPVVVDDVDDVPAGSVDIFGDPCALPQPPQPQPPPLP